MKPLFINVCDFWSGFQFEKTIIYKILTKYYSVSYDKLNPQLVIYSCFGLEHTRYKCTKIKFVGESYSPSETYEIGMDYNYSLTTDNYLYFPLYFLEHYDFEKKISNRDNECCFLVSNNSCGRREELFNYLSKYLPIDSGGKYSNNIERLISFNETDLFFLQYKFSISGENRSKPGYLTEKIFNSLINGCIPIYWGDPLVEDIVNKDCFINANNLSNKEILDKIKLVNDNDNMYKSMLDAPILKDSEYINKLYSELERFLIKIIESNGNNNNNSL